MEWIAPEFLTYVVYTMVAHPYHSALPHEMYVIFRFQMKFHFSLSFDFKFNFKQKLNFYLICNFKCVCKVILKDISIFRANYNHEIHIFLKVNIKLLINRKYEIQLSVSGVKKI